MKNNSSTEPITIPLPKPGIEPDVKPTIPKEDDPWNVPVPNVIPAPKAKI